MSNEEQIARLIEKRNSEPEEVEEIKSPEGEYDLEEIEHLKLENLALKKERLKAEEINLIGAQENLFKSIRSRLGASNEYEIGFNLEMTRVIVRRRQGNGREEQEQQ